MGKVKARGFPLAGMPIVAGVMLSSLRPVTVAAFAPQVGFSNDWTAIETGALKPFVVEAASGRIREFAAPLKKRNFGR